MLKQVSVFSENTKGSMQRITGILAEKGINIWGSITNDSAEYGIVRMVVSDPEKAEEALTQSGCMCRLTDVLGVEVADAVGNLNTLLLSLLDSNISIDYLYLSFNRDTGIPVMILHTEDIGEVESSLKSRGYSLL